jgi:hypothetical protein
MTTVDHVKGIDITRVPRKALQLKKESCDTSQNKMFEPGSRNVKGRNSWQENEKGMLGQWNTLKRFSPVIHIITIMF